MTDSLNGKTVLVTGAARGIGEHVARRAAARGARIAAVGLEPDRLRALAAEIGALWHEADVTDQGSLDDAVREVVRVTGRIDAVVANAGIANIGTVAVSPPEVLVRTVDVNLNGVIRTVAATWPFIRDSRGYYLLVSSVAAFTALPGMAAYSASKAGIEQFGNVLRQETAHLGVRVGTAHPSWVDTDMVRDTRRDLPSMDSTLDKLPWPLRGTTSVDSCAATLVRAVERRSRRAYVPGQARLVQACRTLVLSPVGDAVVRRRTSTLVPALEAETRSLGRYFGVHSVAEGSGARRTDPSDAEQSA